MPHGHCYFWTPGLLWLNVVSDSLTAGAYFSIPFTLWYLIRKRSDIPFNWMFLAFGVFIFACGATHVMDIWTTWYPAYWLSGYVRALTAVASIITAILLVHLTPSILSIPSRKEVIRANETLLKTNAELQEANRMLAKTHRHLLQREKMALLGSLVAGVAHEINTPIGIIVTCSSMLARDSRQARDSYWEQTMSEEGLQEFLHNAEQSAELIQSNATRAADLVTAFKQVAVDQSVEELREINVAKYLSEAIASLSPVLKRASVSVDVTGPDDLMITTYPGALVQVVTNLVQNSIKHGFESRSGHIHIRFDKIDGQVLLVYSDNGSGIKQDLRDKVFEPFFTTKRDKGGSGLGLHILHNLVTSTLKGSVRIEDPEAERGVRFVIEFPFDGLQPG